VLTVVVHGSGVSRGLREKCSILIDILDVVDPPGADVSGRGRVFLLEEAPEVAQRLCEEMLASGFVIRVDLPPDAGISDPFPTIARDHDDLSVVMGLLRRHASDKLLYPIAFWMFSTERERDLNRIIDAFYSLGRDSSLFDDAIAGGAMRLAAFPSSLTLSLRCSDLGPGQEWVRRAMESAPLEARWQAE
jgi:hypothetical protein